MSAYSDRSGAELELLAWARLAEDDDYVRVAIDEVQPATVSTIWLGLAGQRFETITFDAPANIQWRYETEDAARAGHVEVVEEVMRLINEGGQPVGTTGLYDRLNRGIHRIEPR